jgi:UDP:flavonoid glycosyltransferase YjiC (YdhE family)
MRVLFTIQPALGHFHPLVPLARALIGAGHEVAFACGQSFCSVARAAGFLCFPAGPDEGFFAETHAERMVADLIPLCQAGQPTLIVRDTTELGGYLAAETMSIPHVTVQVGAHCPPEPPWGGIKAEVNRLRYLLNLPPDSDLSTLYRHLHLSFAPPSYQRLGGFVPAKTKALRSPIFDGGSSEVPPAWLYELPKRPTVYATLGTVSNLKPGIFWAIIAALREEPINLIVTVGCNQNPDFFGPNPPNVRVLHYIPQSLLLPYCDVVITHGGFNTVLTAISHGLPMVIIPLFADQPENARRCEILGLGRVISPEALTQDGIRWAVYEVWRNLSYRQNVRSLLREMQSLPGLEFALQLLDTLAQRSAM